MSQNLRLIEGTNIPEDPRKRSKRQGRFTIQIFMEIDPDVLKAQGFSDITDSLRAFIDTIEEEDINSFVDDANEMIGYEGIKKIEFGVGR